MQADLFVSIHADAFTNRLQEVLRFCIIKNGRNQ